MSIASLFTIIKIQKQPQIMVYLYSRILVSNKQEDIFNIVINGIMTFRSMTNRIYDNDP